MLLTTWAVVHDLEGPVDGWHATDVGAESHERDLTLDGRHLELERAARHLECDWYPDRL